MTDWLKQYKWHAAGGVALVLIISAAFMLLSGKRETSSGLSFPEEASAQTFDKKEEAKREKNAGKEEVIIDLKGAVKNPGVYQMKEGDRVHDALKKAGGTVKKADQKQINLAAVLQDGMVVYIQFEGEETAGSLSEAGSRAEGNSGGLVNINTASSEELQAIPGIGPSKAEAVIEYREENGPFQTIEDITNVSGIGEKSFERIKSSITVK
ncbi:helix-hairpin-helix domain-containing protein [Bacillus haynesii]|uniref:helix-hairpin-helix domain-containing protein n=1 Tax=Bacillus haynesii TaxID=1925021 RepID=UPI002DB8E25C|nr:helix-hairpin-helix domain-containing protein [Bacillus haynesii]MEC1506863.1 helix-hairpin-helix domain-containing protein [Bacillus haynesii]